MHIQKCEKQEIEKLSHFKKNACLYQYTICY